MPSPQRVQLSIPASAEFISVVRLAVSGVAARMNFTIEDIEDIKVALSEACTNAIQHAYQADAKGQIEIEFILHDASLEMIVQDHGKGFNTTENIKAEKSNSSPEDFGLGLGLVFIQSLMDEAEINSIKGKGTTLKMLKNLSTHAA